jgi:hypothetical protein
MYGSVQERQYIVDYVASQASDETVEHLEKIASERALGRDIEVWDVHTDVGRWWVITAPTNLYSQEQFPSIEASGLLQMSKPSTSLLRGASGSKQAKLSIRPTKLKISKRSG